MMVPEPENEHDEHAIAVKRLDGEMLGYVPKEENRGPAFKGRVLFGYVESVGSVLNKPYVKGFKVELSSTSLPCSCARATLARSHLVPLVKRQNLPSLAGSISTKAASSPRSSCTQEATPHHSQLGGKD